MASFPSIPNNTPSGLPSDIPTTLPSGLPNGIPSNNTSSASSGAGEENTISASSIRTIVDGNTDVFRYGLFKYEESAYEDPTYLGFTLEIDTETSALFNWVKPFLEKHSTSRVEHNARIPVYEEFVNKIIQLFKSQDSVSDNSEQGIYIKSHYINTISGLDALSKKFINWKKDALEIELHEDISLYSSYIASLYNNLVYSYETGRVMIPENLIKFNLYIKISEIRNLTSLAKLNSTDPNDIEIANALKNNVTCIVYKLTDCEFDFTESKPFSNDITQAGIGASTVTQAYVPMKIFFKSVSRQVFNPLIKKAVAMKDDELDLGLVIVGYSGDKKTNGQATDPSSTTLNEDGSNYEESSNTAIEDSPKATNAAFLNSGNKKASSASTYQAEYDRNNSIEQQNDLNAVLKDKLNIQAYNKELAPEGEYTTNSILDQGGLDAKNLAGGGFGISNIISNPEAALGNLANAAKTKGMALINQKKQEGLNKLKQLRAELVNSFIYDVNSKLGLDKMKTGQISPSNVYTDSNYFKNLGENVLNQAGFDATGLLKNILNG